MPPESGPARVRAALDLEPGPVAVGLLVGVAGLVFLSTPVLSPLVVGDVAVSTVLVSTAVLATGFALGAVVFARRGRGLLAAAHGVFGVAFGLLSLAPVVGGAAFLYAGVVVLVAGAAFLVDQQRRRR